MPLKHILFMIVIPVYIHSDVVEEGSQKQLSVWNAIHAHTSLVEQPFNRTQHSTRAMAHTDVPINQTTFHKMWSQKFWGTLNRILHGPAGLLMLGNWPARMLSFSSGSKELHDSSMNCRIAAAVPK